MIAFMSPAAETPTGLNDLLYGFRLDGLWTEYSAVHEPAACPRGRVLGDLLLVSSDFGPSVS